MLFLKIMSTRINVAAIRDICLIMDGYIAITCVGAQERDDGEVCDFEFTESHVAFTALATWLDAGMLVPKSDQPIQVFDVVAWHEAQTKPEPVQ